MQSKGLNGPEKQLFDFLSSCSSVQTSPEVSHKVTCVQTAQLSLEHQMFNSVCACQSTLKMQVALGACQPGTVTDMAQWDLLEVLGVPAVSCQAGTALLPPKCCLSMVMLKDPEEM